MAKPTISDPDFSFLKGADDRRLDKRIREQIADHRRTQVSATDPRAGQKTPWKVVGRDKPAPPMWRIDRNPDGSPQLIYQVRRNPNGIDVDERFTGRRYKVEITSAVAVAGEHCEPGVQLDCFADAAFTIHSQTGRILEEYPEV